MCISFLGEGKIALSFYEKKIAKFLTPSETYFFLFFPWPDFPWPIVPWPNCPWLIFPWPNFPWP